jgi:hypothetical protein
VQGRPLPAAAPRGVEGTAGRVAAATARAAQERLSVCPSCAPPSLLRVASFGEDILDARKEDPLSSQARSQHRNLLLVSAIAILVEMLDPPKISALGLNLNRADHRDTIRWALVAALIYFAVSYALPQPVTCSRISFGTSRRAERVPRSRRTSRT